MTPDTPAPEARLGEDQLVFTRECAVWAVYEENGRRAQEVLYEKPDDHCITSARHMGSGRFLLGIVEGHADGPTTGQIFLAQLERQSVEWLEPVSEGFDDGQDFGEVYLYVEDVHPGGQLAIVSSPYTGGESGGTFWADTWALSPLRSLDSSFGEAGAFSPDGRLSAIGLADCRACSVQVHIYRDTPVLGSLVARIESESHPFAMTFSPASDRLAILTHAQGDWAQGLIRIADRNGVILTEFPTREPFGHLAWGLNGIYHSSASGIWLVAPERPDEWSFVVGDAQAVELIR